MLRYAGTNGANYKTLRERIDDLKRELDLWNAEGKGGSKKKIAQKFKNATSAPAINFQKSSKRRITEERAPSNSDDDYESEEERPMTKRSKH